MNKQINWKNSIYLILIVLAISCFLWFQCRDYCVTFFITNWQIVSLTAESAIRKAVIIIILFFAFKFISNFIIDKVLKKIFSKTDMGEKFTSVSKLSKFGLWSVFLLIVLSIFIGNVTGIAASLGLVGFGLTLALQKPIMNFVGWLTIITKQIYREGDRIQVNGIRGDVKDIQIMNTVLDGLLTSSDVLSGKLITVPNELILVGEVQNFTKESNYILQELNITITFESNYHKAIQLLERIIVKKVHENKKFYINHIRKKKYKINSFLTKILERKELSKKEEQELDETAQKLNQEKQQIEQELKDLEVEFQPNIRVELLDSSIQLTAQFTSPYDQIKKNRTEINLAFLDAIQTIDEIEIAYPHMQLVQSDKSKDLKKK